MKKYKVVFIPVDKAGDHFELEVISPSLPQAALQAYQNLGKIIGKSNLKSYEPFKAELVQS